jgi:sirohydrochlorin ferrochelatase
LNPGVFTEDDGVYGPINIHLTKTTTHEVGYILGTGRADDGQQYVIVPKEVYSGDLNDDPTIEEVILESDTWDQWSVRSRGWNDPLNLQPMAGRHVAFSIEELSMIEFDDVETREED